LAILSDAHRQKVKEMFDAQLKGPVEVLLFYVEAEEQFTAAAREIMTELVALSAGRITLKELALGEAQDEAQRYQIDQVPSLVLLGEGSTDSHMRFYGAPVGYEFMVLLEDLIDVSRGATRLSEAARQQVQGIQQDVAIQVFTTPT
jgi:alkyl hydroperoxide reductase subunit AhpF